MQDVYNFQSVVAVKIIVKKDNDFLLIREPSTNDWMPNRLGFPGGKVLLNESIGDALNRKVKTEIGLNLTIKGPVSIYDILVPEKNVCHLVFLAYYIGGDLDTRKIESQDINWFTTTEIKKFKKDDFAEFYNDEILRDLINGKIKPITPSIIKTQDNRTGRVLEWMEKGDNKL